MTTLKMVWLFVGRLCCNSTVTNTDKMLFHM